VGTASLTLKGELDLPVRARILKGPIPIKDFKQ